MSTKSFNDFRAKVAADKALEAAVRKAYVSGNKDEVAKLVDLARSQGFDFTTAEAQAVMDEAELSDLELELVAGGTPIDCGEQKAQRMT